ncbi:MAG: HAD-IIIA family hydrolase [Chitinophagales bacterium]|nr:HAD-IIIA family hydrolase [Chitinophagales bacterium]MDW8427680.1 HAD-IIIA family hydrolase [Chitinophagales bacterium]
MDAIVLAGGLGTRLRPLVADVPKPMARIGGIPFLEYVFHYAVSNGVTCLWVACGYRHEAIQEYFGNQYQGIPIRYVVEQTPLGTGGGLRKAIKQSAAEEYIVLNGDTIFCVPLRDLVWRSRSFDAELALALKPMKRLTRYGVVQTETDGRIVSFHEKNYYEKGTINGGVYYVKRSLFEDLVWPEAFSLEQDVLQTHYRHRKFYGFGYDAYFIDIGVPDDFFRARKELPDHVQPRNPVLFPDASWTLFLDRDGVINQKKDNDYIRSVQEFLFLPEVPEALARLARLFGRIIIVTNQQGVGKGIMRMEDVDAIHNYMKEQVRLNGGRIDAVYVAPELASPNPVLRKPATGMAIQAKADFPEIDFRRSVVIGDALTDLEFGKRLGMITVFLAPRHVRQPELADFTAENLAAAVWLFGSKH